MQYKKPRIAQFPYGNHRHKWATLGIFTGVLRDARVDRILVEVREMVQRLPDSLRHADDWHIAEIGFGSVTVVVVVCAGQCYSHWRECWTNVYLLIIQLENFIIINT